MKRSRLCGLALGAAAALLAVVPGNGYAAPEPGLTVPVTTVGTLQPTLTWSPTKVSGVSYDLIITAATNNSEGFWVPGKTAYYRKGLTTTTHAVSQPLLPNTVYVWSVRTRDGKKTSKWAAYNDGHPGLFPNGQRHYDLFWPFKTPGTNGAH